MNQRPFRKREGSRASLYAALDRPALQPLPAERYVMAEWKTVRVNIDYHIEVDRHYYSVPYSLVGEQLEARSTAHTVEIFHRGKRVVSHVRNFTAYHHSTVREHMPKSHQAHLEWTPSRVIHWGESVGEATAQVVRTILDSKPHPEMGYRACLGILRLAKTYSNPRLEAACQRALQAQACSYPSLKSILKRGLDGQPTLAQEPERTSPQHENLRGGHSRDLFESICDLFQEHLALFRNQCEILAYWCFASWFPEVLRFVPRLTITGPRFAADLLFRVVRGVCRRPVLLAGMNSAVLKAIPLNELMPTLLIRETSLNKRKAELLDASDQKDYLVASGKDLRHYCCAKCIYLGEGHSQQATLPDGIHIHVGNARFPGYLLSWDRDIEVFQNKLFLYRSLHYFDVLWSRFRVDGLLPELCAVAQQLGAAIVGDDDLQKHVVDSLKEQSEQARVDRASGTKAMVLRAVLFHCHQR